jgi:WD40 repeat protein
MKIKVLTRREDDCTRERRCDLQKVHRNPDPVLHPFERAREYQRALNAVKLDRVFAKPFLHAMDGHSDGVFCMSKNPKRLNILASGACDGEFRVWQLSGRKCLLAVENAHAVSRHTDISGAFVATLYSPAPLPGLRPWSDLDCRRCQAAHMWRRQAGQAMVSEGQPLQWVLRS